MPPITIMFRVLVFFIVMAVVIYAMALVLAVLLGVELKPLKARIISWFISEDYKAEKASAKTYKETEEKLRKRK